MNDSHSKTAKKLPPMDVALQAHLGAQLRQLFAETANQPIPRRLAALLDRLEASDAAASAPQDPQSRSSIEVNI
jgi:Anti-sigma factor NepR